MKALVKIAGINLELIGKDFSKGIKGPYLSHGLGGAALGTGAGYLASRKRRQGESEAEHKKRKRRSMLGGAALGSGAGLGAAHMKRRSFESGAGLGSLTTVLADFVPIPVDERSSRRIAKVLDRTNKKYSMYQ